MRASPSLVCLSLFAGCVDVPAEPPPAPGSLARDGGGGGWDYNSNRWNSLGERLPFGVTPPGVITRGEHVLWSLDGGPPPCVPPTPGISAVAVQGSHLDGDGAPIGPEVLVTDATGTAPLAPGATVAVAARVRTEAEPGAAARPGALVVTRVADFRRPATAGEVPTRHRWPQYQATWYPASACAAPIDLGVAIVAPAPRFADGQPGYALATLPGVFELAATYHGGQDPALLVKAAFNLDLALALPGETSPLLRACGGAAVANELAFLAAFAIGNASLVGAASGGSLALDEGTGAPVTAASRLVFTTVSGQPIRVSALVQDGAAARALCYAGESAPQAGVAAANPHLAWPETDAIADLDAVVAAGWSLAPDERAADPLGLRLASGASTRRLEAFAAESPLVDRAAIVAEVLTHRADTRLGVQAGALATWAAVRAAAVGRVGALVAIETLPSEVGSYDLATESAVQSPSCGDGVCGWDAVAMTPESCPADCGGIADVDEPVLSLPVK